MSISSITNRTAIASSSLDLASLLNSQKTSTSTTNTQESSSKSAEMRDLVDKVASGTATDAEIAELAAKLKEMAADMEKRFSNATTTDETSSESEMKSLLEKIANGTATDGDVKTIADLLKERASDMQAHFGGGMPPAPPTEASTDDELKALVDAVVAGTATDSDLETLVAKLKEMALEMQNQLADEASTSSTSSTATSSTTTISSNSLMDDLMQKILDGTATTDDVKAIAADMKAHENAMQTNVASSLVIDNGLLAQQFLDSMMQSYEQTESNYTLPTQGVFSV